MIICPPTCSVLNPRWNNGELYVYKKSYDLLPQIVKISNGIEEEVYKYSSLNDDNSFDINGNELVVSKYKVDLRYNDVVHNKLDIIKATGTGNTTGHIADLIFNNKTDQPITLTPQTFYIPSDGEYQSYVGEIPPDITCQKGGVDVFRRG